MRCRVRMCLVGRLSLLMVVWLIGSTALGAEFAGGTGDPNDPYQIATAEQLMSLVGGPSLLEKHYVLVADIDLDPNLPGRRIFDRAVIGGSKPGATDFTGHFSGGGHIIRNLVISSDIDRPVGLFASLARGAEIGQLGVENASVSGTNAVGILAGDNGGSISACYTSGTVVCHSPPKEPEDDAGSKADDTSNQVLHAMRRIYGERYTEHLSPQQDTVEQPVRAGGLVGINHFRIESCYSEAVVQTTIDDSNAVEAGGLVGANSGTIFASYSVGPVAMGASGLIGIDRVATPPMRAAVGYVFQCFWDVQASNAALSIAGMGKATAQMRDAKTFQGWDYGGHWTIADGADYPRLRWEQRAGAPMPAFGSHVAGSGEPNDPFVIRTADDLVKVSRFRAAWDCHLALGDDIDMSSVDANDYRPIGNLYQPFTGTFDGRGRTIRHFTCRNDRDGQTGLFGLLGHRGVNRAPEGLIENVYMRRGWASGENRVGLLVGESWGTLRNCHVEGTVVATDSYVGCLAGFNGGPVEDCSSAGRVTGLEEVGGLIGTSGWGKSDVIERCRSSCTVLGRKSVGGLVGGGSRTIRNSFATGHVKGEEKVGGLIGETNARVCACYATGHVTGQEKVGGLVGDSAFSIVACYAMGAVSGRQDVGGLVGYNAGSVVASYAAGKVEGTEAIGGLIGSQSLALITDVRMGQTLRCFWDRQSSGVSQSDGGAGKTTAELMWAATFDGWGLDGVWVLDEGRDYPRLAWQDRPGERIRDNPDRYGAGAGTPDDPFRIRTVAQLCAAGTYPGDFDAHFVLAEDLDCAGLDPNAFTPIGLKSFAFIGSFDGQGHGISHLTITEPNENYIGLFGNVGPTIFEAESSSTRIANLHLRDIHIQGSDLVGGLAGRLGRGMITNCSVTGRIAADGLVGGLVGWSYGDIMRCRADVDIAADTQAGGLVGQNHGSVTESHAVARIMGEKCLGGLIGVNAANSRDSLSSDCLSSTGGRVVRSCADCTITGVQEIGGVAGYAGECSNIESCYAIGSLTGQEDVGGLLGTCIRTFVTNSYAAVMVSAGKNAGGFIGENRDYRYDMQEWFVSGVMTSCFWDADRAGADRGCGNEPDPKGVSGLPTAQMRQQSSFVGWDFDTVWTIREEQDYPRLRWEEP